ncbi:hypothetical protein B0J13DRAFT_519815 [Dactylonectria estremocensis]|uniref:MARVEL domain-containing protein n=1 Tax=Dactylonectria estremocensis TaxID=1079267 RepID=A0A9P9JBF1_9HYPO|nr:hypothetical protein B0J13DRAFT_519815 [Dactylonectria estremocensis]
MAFAALKKYEPYFAPRFKTPMHLVQMVFIIGVIAVSAARMTMKNSPRGRSTTIGLAMGAKSLVIIGYQLLTEHVDRFNSWASLKAFMILNCLEVAFWGAVAFLTLQANIKQCDGTSCTLGWIVVVLAVILNILANYTAIVSVLDWKHFRNYRMPRGTKISSQRSDQESLATLQIPRQ